MRLPCAPEGVFCCGLRRFHEFVYEGILLALLDILGEFRDAIAFGFFGDPKRNPTSTGLCRARFPVSDYDRSSVHAGGILRPARVSAGFFTGYLVGVDAFDSFDVTVQ